MTDFFFFYLENYIQVQNPQLEGAAWRTPMITCAHPIVAPCLSCMEIEKHQRPLGLTYHQEQGPHGAAGGALDLPD